MNKGPWKVNSSNRVYADEFIDVNVDKIVGTDDRKRSYSTVKLKPGVAVLAIDSDDRVYLTKQFRYAISRDSVEVVSGGIDPGKDPLAAAKMELKEEIGVQAKEWLDLGTTEMDSSVIHCPIRLYVARGLTRIGSDQEATEDISYFTVPFAEALNMVMNSAITHAASCLLILKAHNSFIHQNETV